MTLKITMEVAWELLHYLFYYHQQRFIFVYKSVNVKIIATS